MSPYVKSVLFGGIWGGLISAVLEIADTMISDLIDILLCLTLPLCGFLAVRHYVQSQGKSVTGGEGVGLGAAAGALGGLLTSAAVTLMILSGIGPSLTEIEAVMPPLEGSAANAINLVLRYIHWILLITLTALGAVLGLVGGAVGWRVFRPSAADA